MNRAPLYILAGSRAECFKLQSLMYEVGAKPKFAHIRRVEDVIGRKRIPFVTYGSWFLREDLEPIVAALLRANQGTALEEMTEEMLLPGVPQFRIDGIDCSKLK